MESVGTNAGGDRAPDGIDWAANFERAMRALEEAGKGWGRTWDKAADKVAERVAEKLAAMREEDAHRPSETVRGLLKRYTLLRDHCESAVYDQRTMIEDERKEGAEYYDLMTSLVSKWDVRVKSVETSAGRTLLMLEHVDRALDAYRNRCESSPLPSEQRRWRVLRARFLETPRATTQMIAEDEHVDESTVRRDINAACDDIAVLLFGLEGVST